MSQQRFHSQGETRRRRDHRNDSVPDDHSWGESDSSFDTPVVRDWDDESLPGYRTRKRSDPWSDRAAQISAISDDLDIVTPDDDLWEIGDRLRAMHPSRRRNMLARWARRFQTAGSPTKALTIALVVLLLFFFCAPGVTMLRLAFVAKDGYDHLNALESLVSSQGVGALLTPVNLRTAQDHLAAAHTDFLEIERAMHAGSFIVNANSGLTNDARLVRVIIDLTAAGEDVLSVANTAFAPLLSNPFASMGTSGLTSATLDQVSGVLVDAQLQLNEAVALASALTDDGLVIHFAGAGRLQKVLDKIRDFGRLANQMGAILDVAPALLGVGTPSSYLLLAMDRSELRTGGGFIGNFGIIPVDGGRIGEVSLQDTYLLDEAYYSEYHQQVPDTYPWWPYRYGSTSYGWGLRDSGLSPDFPTNARTALGVIKAVGDAPILNHPAPVVGVVAITSVVMAQVIAISGGTLTLPEYPDRVITPENLDDTIHCFQLGACRDQGADLQPGDDGADDRKRFTAFLGQALVDRVRHLSKDQLKHLLSQIIADLSTKDLQVFFQNPEAESVITDMGAGATLAPTGADTFFVTDTNIGGNKANAYVTQNEEDIVTLYPDGSALHRLLIHTEYRRQGALYEGSTGQTAYWAYRRVYLTDDAQLIGQAGFAGGAGTQSLALTTKSDTPNRTMFGATYVIADGSGRGQCKVFSSDPHGQPWNCDAQARDTYLYWVTPNAWKMVNGKAVYTLTVQRQPGSAVNFSVRVDASHLHDEKPPILTASAIVRNYDPVGNTANGFSGMPGDDWSALEAQSSVLDLGTLTKDMTLTWTGR